MSGEDLQDEASGQVSYSAGSSASVSGDIVLNKVLFFIFFSFFLFVVFHRVVMCHVSSLR